MRITLDVDGEPTELDVEPRALLGQLLRDDLSASGVRLDCETSTCGACTVLLEGRPVKSCAVLGVMADQRPITTAAGLGSGVEGDLAAALDSRDVLPCGECAQAVQLVLAALLRSNPDASRDEARRALSGTICRCTGYQKVVDLVDAVGSVAR